jgi:hypothetical protein
MTRRTIHWTSVLALVIVTGACSSNDKNGVAASGDTVAPAASETAYCDAAREWAIYDMTPVDDSDPAAFRAYWKEWTAFEQAAVDTAPAEIKADWQLKLTTETETFTPVLEKYEFDVAALMESGTPEEQAATEAPPGVQAAQDRILTYEGQVCGAQFPLAADVSYAGEEPGPYCELVAAEDQRNSEVLGAGADPAALKKLVAGAAETEAALAEAAPEVIKADVIAVGKWTVGPQADALERHGWDIKAVIRDGSAKDRADLNYTDEKIREPFSRVAAYEEQVCGG